MLDFMDPLLVCSLLASLMSLVTGRQGSVLVGWGVRIKHSDVEVCSLERPAQKPLAAMSNLAPLWELAVALSSTSPVTGCNSGSMHSSYKPLLVRWL